MQLIGITVTGLEPEFQPIVNYLLPHIISSKQDDNDMHLQVEDTATAELLLHTLIVRCICEPSTLSWSDKCAVAHHSFKSFPFC